VLHPFVRVFQTGDYLLGSHLQYTKHGFNVVHRFLRLRVFLQIRVLLHKLIYPAPDELKMIIHFFGVLQGTGSIVQAVLDLKDEIYALLERALIIRHDLQNL